MRPLKSCAVCVCLSASFLPATFCAAAKPIKTTNSATMPMAQMPSVAPLFIEDGDFTSTLILVNGSSIATYADVSVRALDGKTVAMERVQFQPHSQQQVQIRALLDSAKASGVTAGSIIVMQSPDLNGTVITAVLSMTRLSSSPTNYINQELAMPTANGSQTLRTVADAEGGFPIVSITSLSDMPQHVKVRCLTSNTRNSTKTVDLSANETLLTEACSEETFHGADFQRYDEKERSELHGPVGVELISDGMPGSFAAFTLIPHRSQDHTFFSSAVFSDPKMIMSSTTVFAGVPVGSANLLPAAKYVPTLSLANFSGKNSNVTIRYARTVDTDPASQDLEKVVVPAHSSKEVSFPHLQGEPNLQNSFLIVADGSPGDVAAKLVARGDSQLREVEQLGKDLMDPHNGGNHPWSIEGGTESTLLLFNTSESPQFFDVAITGAGVTWHKAYQLKPMQTIAISINNLINHQTKDDKGVHLPKDAWKGQVDWYLANLNTGRGRILQSNREKNMARDFSCVVVIDFCGLQFNGSTSVILDGQIVNFGSVSPFVCYDSCSGTPAGSGCSGCTYSWSSEAPSIASISGTSSDVSVSVFGASPGYTHMDAFASGMSCSVQLSPPPAAPVISATINSADITADSISISLNSPGTTFSGQLALKLISSAGSTTLYNGSASTGTHSYSFNLSGLPTQEFTQVSVSWTVSGTAATATYSYHFKNLGVYKQTQYNSPAERTCSGSPQTVAIWSPSCGKTVGSVLSGFDFRVTDPKTGTGSGHSVSYGDVSEEFLCSVGSGDLRSPFTIKGSLGSVGATTVAVCKNNADLYVANRRLYIVGEGVKTVTDACTACCSDITHLDNYTTNTACSGVTSLPNAITVILY